MFEREAHRIVLQILEAFRPEALEAFACPFAGGTRLAMDLGEFRESRDVDFLCADASRYADLRLAVAHDGYAALFTGEGLAALGLPREPRADSYGVRFPVIVGARSIRVELIREGRIPLGAPVRPAWSPVACLAIVDCFAEKLLANCDRWPDRDSLARDLVDLAALSEAHGPVPAEAWHAAESAYKGLVRESLRRAAESFLGDATYQARCFDGLSVAQDRRDRLVEAISRLGLGE